MRHNTGLLLATLATTFTLASGHALATSTTGAGTTTSGDEGIGETGGGNYSSAWFVAPLTNTLFEGAPVTIAAEVGVYQGTDDSITDVEVYVDDALIGTQPCPDGCIFTDIVLDQGVHELKLVASPNGDTASVTVYVDEEIPSTPECESGGTTSESGGTTSESGSDGGGCNAQGEPNTPWSLLTIPMLLLVPAFRRTRK